MTDDRYDFVVFSDDWGRHASSCQHLFGQLARRHRVLWVNTIGMRRPKADRFTIVRGLDKLRQWTHPLRRVHEGFFVYSPPMLPAAGGAGGRVNSRLLAGRLRQVLRRCGMSEPVLLTTVPTAADYVGRLGERALVYYITDDYRHWPGADADAVAVNDEQLTRQADLLLPVSEALAEGRRPKSGASVLMLPHAVDLDHFAGVDRPWREPADLAGIPHPRLCFFGLIYEKVDLMMLGRLASENADKHVVLLGPAKVNTSALAALPNVHLLGARPYSQLPRYLKHMDVLLLPYVLDDQILRSAPLKIRECLAVGKPIVAVDVPDLRRYRHLIRLAGGREAYIAACLDACRDGHVPAARMRAAVAADSWAQRARQVDLALSGVLAGAASAGGRATTRVAICENPKAWDGYVDAHADGSVWHRWGWPEAMRLSYGLRCRALAASRAGRVVGVLPLALQASHVFGRHLVSLPWLDHAGILADDEAARAALLSAAVDLAGQWRADLTLRELTPCAAAANTQTDKVAMMLDLPGVADQLWRRFKPKVRNQIRKGLKAGLTGRWAGTDGLGEFLAVYAANMRDLGSPPQSLGFFREVFRQLADVARLLLVRQGAQVVAAAVVLADGRAWQVPWASSLRRFNWLCPNHVLYWTILSEACGCVGRFCFGRSSRDSGTYRFKAQWGAQAVQICRHTYSGAPAAGRQGGRLVAAAQWAWRKIPVPLAQALGPYVVKCVG